VVSTSILVNENRRTPAVPRSSAFGPRDRRRSQERDITEMGAEWSLQLSFMRDLSPRWVMCTDQPAEFPCAFCSRSVDLTIDLNTDEKGKAVHQQ